MRNYWLRIFTGAFAIFAIGMIGVTMARRGIAKVNSVVDSSDPITIPLSLFPFFLDGERLGKLERVVVLRDSPRQIRSVELDVNLADSLVAQGLSGCRLSANFESDSKQEGINIRTADDERHAFSCLPGDSIPQEWVEFGQAVFHPGEVRVPLYVHQDLVREVHQSLAGDSVAGLTEEEIDSLTALAELASDPEFKAMIAQAESLGRAGRRLGDSLRAAGLRQGDSAHAQARRMADSVPRP